MLFRQVVDLLCCFAIFSRTSYTLHAEKRCEELRAIKSGKYMLHDSEWYFGILWVNMIQCIWIFECIAVYWGALFQALKLSPGTRANNFLQRRWTGGAGPLFSSHCFHSFSTSSWKVRKCRSLHVVIQKNPTSNSLLHCPNFSETLRGVQRRCHCVDPLRAFCAVCASNAPSHQKLLDITKSHKRYHSTEKSLWKAIEFAAQVNQQKVLESCQLLLLRHHRVSLIQVFRETQMHFVKRTGWDPLNLMRRKKVGCLADLKQDPRHDLWKTHQIFAVWHPSLRISWNIQFLKLFAFSLALPILLDAILVSAYVKNMNTRIQMNINELWPGHLYFDKRRRGLVKS